MRGSHISASTATLLVRLTERDRAVVAADVRERLRRSVEQVITVATNLRLALDAVEGAHDNAAQVARATYLQVRTDEFREHVVALLADHRLAQTVGLIPDPYFAVGVVEPSALDVDLYLAARVVGFAASRAQRVDGWQDLNTARASCRSAVERIETYARSVRDLLGGEPPRG